LETPGDYVLVDHAIFRAFNKCTLGVLSVGGNENGKIYAATQSGLTGPASK
jgi:nitrite reductase (NO-forming)